MKKNTFTKTAQVQEITLEDFILGDEKESINSTVFDNKKKHWENARIDMIKLMNVRMPEEYYLKLDYLSKKNRISKNKLCLEAIIAEIDRMLGE